MGKSRRDDSMVEKMVKSAMKPRRGDIIMANSYGFVSDSVAYTRLLKKGLV